MPTFEELVAKDVQDVFLGEYARSVTYTDNSGVPKIIKAQLFFEKADNLEVAYEHAWCDATDVPNIASGDLFEIDGVNYGVLEYVTDEFKNGIDIYLNKV